MNEGLRLLIRIIAGIVGTVILAVMTITLLNEDQTVKAILLLIASICFLAECKMSKD